MAAGGFGGGAAGKFFLHLPIFRIGRGWGWGRGEILGGAGSFKKKKKNLGEGRGLLVKSIPRQASSACAKRSTCVGSCAARWGSVEARSVCRSHTAPWSRCDVML